MSLHDNVIHKQVVCRPALPIDSPGMLQITRQIWEGEDYVPKVWSGWLFDPQGLLAIAEYAGKVVGFAKLTKLSKKDWWLEGLRVHPQYEGNRIASRLHKYLLDFWQKNGSGTIRFATVSYREPVKHLARINGFDLVGEYSTYKAPTLNTERKISQENPFTPVSQEEIPSLFEWFNRSSKESLPYGMMDLGWQYAPPREQYFTNYLDKKQVWWWRKDQGVLILVEKKDGSETVGRIRMLACDKENLVEFLSDTHALVSQFGYASVTWMAPLIPGIEKLMSPTVFQRDWDNSLLIFAKLFSIHNRKLVT